MLNWHSIYIYHFIKEKNRKIKHARKQINMTKLSVFTTLFFLPFRLFSTRLQMKILSLFFNIIHNWTMLWCFLFLRIYFSEWLWHLLKSLSYLNTIFSTDLEKLHALSLAKLLYLLFFHLSILLLTIDFITQNT